MTETLSAGQHAAGGILHGASERAVELLGSRGFGDGGEQRHREQRQP